jgi:predicted metalloprotease with PDZ domain
VRLPAGWQQASALRVAQQRREGETELLEFQRVSLETLVDSPLFAGAHLRRVPLEAPGSARPVVLNIVADTPELLREISEEQLQAHRRLVEQADRLFGARHFAKYDFLLALSDQLGGIGLEHHESSENGVKPGYFRDWAKRAGSRELLPHEYVHSWNGKFRRPLDLWTPHYNLPMRNSLLWLYEGQTQYWGKLLAARSGLVSAEQAREGLAQMAATAAHRAGRVWRSLQDTTVEPSSGRRGAMPDWRNWQRGADYYDEAALVWLDADTLIREKSGGQRSLDDFARAFFGMEDGRVQPLTYRFDDVVEALERIQPHDWRRFLRERLDRHEPQAPLDGLERAGWRLSWAETESEFARHNEAEGRAEDFAYSLGLYLKRDGHVDGVLWDSPAWSAGLSRAVQLVAVNGTAYKAERLAAAIAANKGGQAPIALLLKEGERYRSITLDYRGGLRYPRLTRIEDRPERLDAELLAPRR